MKYVKVKVCTFESPILPVPFYLSCQGTAVPGSHPPALELVQLEAALGLCRFSGERGRWETKKLRNHAASLVRCQLEAEKSLGLFLGGEHFRDNDILTF